MSPAQCLGLVERGALLLAVRDIEEPVAVHAVDAVEARAIQEQGAGRALDRPQRVGVNSPYSVVVLARVLVSGQSRDESLRLIPHHSVEVRQLGVEVGQKCSPGPEAEEEGAAPDEGLVIGAEAGRYELGQGLRDRRLAARPFDQWKRASSSSARPGFRVTRRPGDRGKGERLLPGWRQQGDDPGTMAAADQPEQPVLPQPVRPATDCERRRPLAVPEYGGREVAARGDRALDASENGFALARLLQTRFPDGLTDLPTHGFELAWLRAHPAECGGQV